jgi:hypothetical protein
MNMKRRNELVSIARYMTAHASLIHYEQRRPMELPKLGYANVQGRFRSGLSVSADCSEMVTAVYKWAGCKDPNGDNYDGAGWSGAMYAHLVHRYTNPSGAHPGAIGVYGPSGDEHVIMVLEHDNHDPLVFSHGSEIGPLILRLSNESAAHRGQPFTFLDVGSIVDF